MIMMPNTSLLLNMIKKNKGDPSQLFQDMGSTFVPASAPLVNQMQQQSPVMQPQQTPRIQDTYGQSRDQYTNSWSQDPAPDTPQVQTHYPFGPGQLPGPGMRPQFPMVINSKFGMSPNIMMLLSNLFKLFNQGRMN